MLRNLLKLPAEHPELIAQHRTGRFSVQCRVLDGTRVVDTGTLQLEILLKGRFSEGNNLAG